MERTLFLKEVPVVFHGTSSGGKVPASLLRSHWDFGCRDTRFFTLFLIFLIGIEFLPFRSVPLWTDGFPSVRNI